MTKPAKVADGTLLPIGTVEPTEVQLFRFSAATWNAHRIHYDKPYAGTEGYDGVVVQSHLLACYVADYVVGWAGPAAALRRIRWQNRAVVVASDSLTLQGAVESDRIGADGRHLELQVDVMRGDGVLCVTAQVEVVLDEVLEPN